MLSEGKLLSIPLHPCIEPAAMTGVNATPIPAGSVAGTVKHAWYVAVDVIAGDSSLRSFGGFITIRATIC